MSLTCKIYSKHKIYSRKDMQLLWPQSLNKVAALLVLSCGGGEFISHITPKPTQEYFTSALRDWIRSKMIRLWFSNHRTVLLQFLQLKFEYIFNGDSQHYDVACTFCATAGGIWFNRYNDKNSVKKCAPTFTELCLIHDTGPERLLWPPPLHAGVAVDVTRMWTQTCVQVIWSVNKVRVKLWNV